MISFMEEFSANLETKLTENQLDEQAQVQARAAIESMSKNVENLKPVIDAADQEYKDVDIRDIEMAKLIHEFKNQLLIEIIKLDTWEARNKDII